MKTKNVIATRLKQIREERELEVGELAQLSGVSEAHIYRIEAGKRPNVSATVLSQLANALQISLDFLTGLSENPLPASTSNSPILRDLQFHTFFETWRLLSELADMGDEAGRNAKTALRLQAEAYKNLAAERLKRKKAEE